MAKTSKFPRQEALARCLKHVYGVLKRKQQDFTLSRSVNLLAVSICEGVGAIVLLVRGLVDRRTDYNYWLFTAVVGLMAVLTWRDRKRDSQ